MKKLFYFYFIVSICALLDVAYSLVMTQSMEWVSLCILVAMAGSMLSIKKLKMMSKA